MPDLSCDVDGCDEFAAYYTPTPFPEPRGKRQCDVHFEELRSHSPWAASSYYFISTTPRSPITVDMP